MICISTGQNITNLIPAVQYNITSLLLIESETAKNKSWSNGIIEVLLKRNVIIKSPIYLSTKFNSDINKIKEIIKSSLPNEPVIFNMGGGQKPHIIAMWELFKERKKDIACYADQDKKGILQIWEYKENELISTRQDINVNLTAEEIFTTFGFKVVPDFKLIYGKGINYRNDTLDLFREKEFRELLFNIPKVNDDNSNNQFTLLELDDFIKNKRLQLLNDIENKLIPKFHLNEHLFTNFLTDLNFKKIVYNTLIKTTLNTLSQGLRNELPIIKVNLNNPLLIELAGNTVVPLNDSTFNRITGFYKPAFYFEDICTKRMVTMLNNSNHNITEAFANIKIEKENVIVAEYDILLVTNEGKIVAYDAKTFDFESKDIDARLYNLEKGSGFYRKFNAIIPFAVNDIQNNILPPVLLELPFKLMKKNIDFFVIDDDIHQSFFIKKDKNKIIVNQQNDKDSIKCKLFETCLEYT